MMPCKVESRPPLPLESRRAQAGSRGLTRGGSTWQEFLVALLRALSVAAA
jgi:hypothetical protein